IEQIQLQAAWVSYYRHMFLVVDSRTLETQFFVEPDGFAKIHHPDSDMIQFSYFHIRYLLSA
ncbi:MAG TPA: hypothetical protein VGO51_00135, partial [Burkholderiaceae bacterium]|nr:hypothetical protein [Burkholderiaceae bacterium]